MWSARRKRRSADAQLLLGQTFWGLFHPSSEWQRSTCEGWMDGLSQARQALGSGRSRRFDVQIWLSGAICPALWLVPPTGLKDKAEWQAWAVAAAIAQHPLQSALAEPVIWIESDQSRPTLAAAIPDAWLGELKEGLGPHLIRGIRPMWSSAFLGPAVGSPDGMELWSAFDGESLSCFQVNRERLAGALTLPGIAELVQTRALHTRRMVGASFAVSKLLHLDPDTAVAQRRGMQDAWSEVAP